MRVVHYINQFQAGIGGEDAASTPPRRLDGPVGPGRLLAQLLGPDHPIVATLVCGDDYAASTPGCIEELLVMARAVGAELVVAGPAFTSGRYGLACARIAAAATAVGLPAIAAMHPDNPGIVEAGQAPIIATGPTARALREAIERLAVAIRAVAAGEELGPEQYRVGPGVRRNRLASTIAAERAVALVLSRLAGEDRTEIPTAASDTVPPAAPVEDAGMVTIALATEGGIVPAANPDRIPSARATSWASYDIGASDALAAGAWTCIDGGFSPVAADADPNRIVPLDAARGLEREGRIGALHPRFFVTVGNGMSVQVARRMGAEWAAELHRAGVQAVILTAT